MPEESEDFIFLDDELEDNGPKKPESRKLKLPRMKLLKRERESDIPLPGTKLDTPQENEEIEISIDGVH